MKVNGEVLPIVLPGLMVRLKGDMPTVAVAVMLPLLALLHNTFVLLKLSVGVGSTVRVILESRFGQPG